MLMKTSHDVSMRVDIELFPRGPCVPPTAYPDMQRFFKTGLSAGPWESFRACVATVKPYDVGHGLRRESLALFSQRRANHEAVNLRARNLVQFERPTGLLQPTP
jgi:hypothetical protein